MTTLPITRGSDEISDTTNKQTNKHNITPYVFNTFDSSIDHYYNDIEQYETGAGGKIWRKHLSSKQKIFQRMKRVIHVFRKRLYVDNISSTPEIKQQFNDYYQSSNRSLASLVDMYAKNIPA